jgi:histidinol-phosphate phosphatase family protein
VRRLDAVFLDRDGTLIADRHFLGNPTDLELLPGAASAIARLNRAAVPVYLVTNQSGIGRGYFGTEDFHAVQRRLVEVLAQAGAFLDGVYFCPHAPDDPPRCDCRKPATGLFLRAAQEHRVQLSRAAFVGDRLRDVLPALEFGGSGVLIGSDPRDGDVPVGIARVSSLEEAIDLLLDEELQD